jgi:hypothetical protein
MRAVGGHSYRTRPRYPSDEPTAGGPGVLQIGKAGDWNELTALALTSVRLQAHTRRTRPRLLPYMAANRRGTGVPPMKPPRRLSKSGKAKSLAIRNPATGPAFHLRVQCWRKLHVAPALHSSHSRPPRDRGTIGKAGESPRRPPVILHILLGALLSGWCACVLSRTRIRV